MQLLRTTPRHRDFFVWSLLAASVLISYGGSFALKLGTPSADWLPWFGRGLAVVLPLKLGIFRAQGLHRGMWRYAGLRDLLVTSRAVLLASAVLAVLSLAVPAPLRLLPVVVLDALLSLLLVGFVRVSPRLLQEWNAVPGSTRSVVVIGAGDAGEAVVRELSRAPRAEFRPVAFVDDDPTKQGKRIHGIPVLGRIEELPQVLERCEAEALLLAICRLPAARLRSIRALAKGMGLPLKRIPPLEEMLSGRASIDDLRDLSLEELLEREPVRTNREPVDALLQGRRVMVTGAAGSIGSELCRQILAHEPAELLLVDQNENALFAIEHELAAQRRPVRCVPVLCSVQDAAKLGDVFSRSRPHVVFHAAAYKHVPVLEHFPEEAVRNNVKGTRNVAELADRHGCERMVLISTDKAVRPTSVMGTTKRVAELLVGEMDAHSSTRFTTIRFGNVLGSNGSVMQLFRQQIERGGPVTVTHPDMRRFFMSIPEAVELVLFAAAMDAVGSTFVLDMGSPVRILDLARHFIRLSGLEPDRDIPIEFVGLRPGEKLYEELWTEAESPTPTQHPSILRAPRAAGRIPDLQRRIQTLVDWAEEGHRVQVIEHLRGLVPEYTGEPVCLSAPSARGWAPGEGIGVEERRRPAAQVRESLPADFSSPEWELTPLVGVSATSSTSQGATSARTPRDPSRPPDERV